MFRLAVLGALITVCLGASPRVLRRHFDGRIVGGTPTDISNYPYQVSMQVLESHYCGGSIISNNWVLTAGHCVDGVPAGVVSYRAGSSFHNSGGSLHPAAEITSNPNFDYFTLDYDVAVAKVSVPFEYSDVIQPIAMTTADPPAGIAVIVTGWGRLTEGGQVPVQLQQVQINIVDFDECNNIYMEDYGGITKRMICAGVPEGGKGVCNGDSGGPLVANGNVVGIVSWGASCDAKGFPQVYGDVAALRSWVTSVTDVQ
ncbi:trypsin-7-like [Periplaneta americana]|uniref:trypsin-7-like n=1 Tax=Periplaneta americana TaxID=6978 RepID=UPI0037E8CC2D